MEKIIEIINKLTTITLEDTDKVSLLNRLDNKYLLHKEQLPKLLNQICTEYLILEIDEKRIFNYHTLYFDTEDLSMFTAHHNGKLNRYKIRKREYVDSNLRFLEIKFKNNKGRTIKKRIFEKEINDTFNTESDNFVSTNSPYNSNQLAGKIITTFNRFTLINKKLTERTTIDVNIIFKNHKNEKELNNLVIVEVKKDKYSGASKISEVLREMKIQPSSFSKYCIGTVFTNNDVKQNNFKSRLIEINKYNYA